MTNHHKWNDKSPAAKEWQERTRAKIQASQVIDDAIQAAEGKIEVSTSRATMMKALMDRVLPAQTQAQVEQTNVDAPQDLEGLKEAIKASPELQNLLKDLLHENKKKDESVQISEEINNAVSNRLQ